MTRTGGQVRTMVDLGPGLDVEAIRRDFPVLQRQVHGRPLIYLDNAATSQKPQSVIDALEGFYRRYNSNVHRGMHQLSTEATEAYEAARKTVQRFIGAADHRQIVFVRGATEAINLVATSFAGRLVGEGDEVLLTTMEHHSNIVPWQLLCEQKGARLRVVPINDRGELQLDEFEALLNERTRIVSVVHISNALGTVNPVAAMVEMAHRRGVPVLVDGAQSVPHTAVDVQRLDCDFYAFSGHKMLGPTGIGVLYGRAKLLEQMAPYQGGGEMIRSVSFEKTTYKDPPARFEAGTPNIAGAVGLAAAIDYVQSIGIDRIESRERQLLEEATARLKAIGRLRLIGTAGQKAAVLSFVLEKVHPHDVATILDQQSIAVRAGHHCAQPVMERFGVPATVRASLAFYNTSEEIDALVRGIEKVLEFFR